MNGLDAHALVTLAFTAVVFVLFVWDRWPIATVCLGVLAALPTGFALFPHAGAAGATEPMRFFAGFGHPALVAICSLMVVGHGLVVTGALEPAARVLGAWVAKQPTWAMLAVLVLAGAASGVVNDTPVVVLLIPLLLGAARRAKTHAAGMLMPMNYAVLIGGMGTTIGTSTNLIVVALAASLGVGTLGMFSYTGLVAAAAVPALLYLWLVAPRMLSGVTPPQDELSDEVFDAEIHVAGDSWLDSRELREAMAATQNQLQLVELRRGSRAVARLPSLTLKPGDRLVVRDTAANLKELESQLKAKLHDTSDDEEDDQEAPDGDAKPKDKAPASALLAQLIITPGSPLVGRSVRRERLAERYQLVVVGLRPRSVVRGWDRADVADRPLREGDILLVQGRAESLREAQRDDVGLLLDERFTLPRQDKALIALVVMAAVVLAAATKALPISLAALGGAVAMLLLRCLSWQDATQALSVKVILLVAASLALGDALQVTGATAWLAQHLATASESLRPWAVLALLMGLMGLVTNFVSNNAAAAIGTPLGISLAQALGAPPEAFVLAVLFGCNLCYLTPMGYQTNLLVMNAAGYRFADFLRVGTPLFVIMWVGLSALLAWRYGLLA